MRRLLLTSVTVLSLSACQTLSGVGTGISDSASAIGGWFSSPQTNTAQKSCPVFTISDDLDRYYDLDGSNKSMHLISIDKISGDCRINDVGTIAIVSIDVNFSAVPKSQGRTTLSVPYFIAVLDGEKNILTKENFDIDFEFAGKSVRHDESLQQNIPVALGTDISSYKIITGFQLSEAQLAYAKNKATIETSEVRSISAAGGTTPDPFAGR